MTTNKINKYISMVKNEDKQAGEIFVYGDISSNDWWGDEVTPKAIKSSLDEMKNFKTIDVHINSYGGEVFAGNAIVNIFDNFKKKNNCTINVYIEGIAASMASGIAMAGDKVYMADNSMMMLHKPSSYVSGNADDFKKEVEVLEKVEETLVSNYMRRFNGTEDELRQILSDETWMTAEEAQGYGLVDEIVEGVKVVASAKGVKIGNTEFSNSKVVGIFENKISKKEENELKFVYDEKLKQFGIEETTCENMEFTSEKLLEIANVVKENTIANAEDKFKDVVSQLGKETMTVEELVNYAQIGMNPPEDKVSKDKAEKFDKLVEEKRKEAITNALKAQGDNFNEDIVKKMLNALDYDEIVEQSKIWENQAKERLNAGKRVSIPETQISKMESSLEDNFNENDFKY